MTDTCCCPPEGGNEVCELTSQSVKRLIRTGDACPACGAKGKPVEAKTVRAMVSVSLRQVRDVQYIFCKTRACPVVYFSRDGEQSFILDQVRERVYQKDLEREDVLVCYCFHYSAGELRASPPGKRQTALEDIVTGIQAGQCACDVRNPQGSCCLGNVRGLLSLGSS